MTLKIYPVVLELVRALAPYLPVLRTRSASLGDQLEPPLVRRRHEDGPLRGLGTRPLLNLEPISLSSRPFEVGQRVGDGVESEKEQRREARRSV